MSYKKYSNSNCVLFSDIFNYVSTEVFSTVDSTKGTFKCPKCTKLYITVGNLNMHLKYECGVEPKFQCSFCPHRSKLKGNLMKHILLKH